MARNGGGIGMEGGRLRSGGGEEGPPVEDGVMETSSGDGRRRRITLWKHSGEHGRDLPGTYLKRRKR